MHIRLRLRLQPWPALQVRDFDWWMQFYGNLLHSIWGIVITWNVIKMTFMEVILSTKFWVH